MTQNPTAKFILDIMSGSFKAFSKHTSVEEANQALRNKIEAMMPPMGANGRRKASALARVLPDIYEIIDEVIDVRIREAWQTSAFYNTVVEVRNMELGQKNEFIVDDASTLMVSRFSGNHWDTHRQKLAEKVPFSIPTYWYYVRVYDDLERFLTGAVNINELIDKVVIAYDRYMADMVALAFTDAGTTLPAEFNIAGTLTKEAMRELIARVRAVHGTARIVGTELAVGQLDDLADIRYSDGMADEINMNGFLGRWQGTPVVIIPQGLKPNSYDFSVPNDVLFVIPEGYQPIKLIHEGSDRTLNLDYTDTHDQTLDYQVQRLMGVGVVFPGAFGRFEIV